MILLVCVQICVAAAILATNVLQLREMRKGRKC